MNRNLTLIKPKIKLNFVPDFSIVQISGKQELIFSNLLIDTFFLKKTTENDILFFNRILFVIKNNKINIGNPVLQDFICKGIILQHFFAKNICVFRYKKKKNYKKFNSYKQKFTRIFIL